MRGNRPPRWEFYWRHELERTRWAARRLVAAGSIEIVPKGGVVDPSTAKGPIRLRHGLAFPWKPEKGSG